MRLIDSNILIYSARSEYKELRNYFYKKNTCVSIISKLEVLGYPGIIEKDKNYFNAVFCILKIITVDNILINKAIEIRRQKKLSVADAIIAATALLYNCELVTRNTKDFQNIVDLKILNPVDDK